MQILRGTFDGDLCVTESLVIDGEIQRSTTVADGGRLALHGICGGDVTVERGGVAELWGVIRGSVRNRGGRVTIAGMVEGDVDAPAGETCIIPTSIIRGTVRLAGAGSGAT